MSQARQWATVTLYDFNGHAFAQTRVPTTPKQPGVILWENRYFKQRSITREYIEAAFFLVPVGGHYHSEDSQYSERAAEAAK
jgi:hypothetical protein